MNKYYYGVDNGLLRVYNYDGSLNGSLVAVHDVSGYDDEQVKDLFYRSAFDHLVGRR